ncbi:MAG TPA: 23S rRNA (guanosine(2251)-2'-O)-methyltransferase RlmB [Geobacteraceae bacterium]
MADEIIYGVNPVREALRGTRRAFELFVAQGTTDQRLEKVIRLAEEQGLPVRRRLRQDLTRLCGNEHHQGVALRSEAFVYADLEDVLESWRQSGEAGLLVLLDSIQDPHNLGALIRTAACAGAHGVIIPKDRAVGVTASVEKVAAGATATVPVVQVANIAMLIEQLKQEGFWIFGAAAEAGPTLYSVDLTGHVALVVGGEGEGLRPLVRKHCDGLFTIPLKGGVDSLNASVAGGIALFEVVRQRLAGR